jgi:endonuclease YncB( thermonuclease family)
MRLPFILAVLLIATPGLALANAGGTKPPRVVEGPARIVDGDTIWIGETKIRLYGIDAPETKQTCVVANKPWRCGEAASEALRRLLGNTPVTCEDQGSDRYGRMIGQCFVQGEDIEAWMVLNGWALAYRRYSLDYVDEEKTAQDARTGLWRGDFVPPWEWRKGKRLQPVLSPESATGCVIKGNISSKGERIYHSPGAQHYERTKIDTAKGERWFCTEAEAVVAGWRKARR